MHPSFVQVPSARSQGIQVGRPALFQNEYLKERSNRIFVMAQCPLPQPSTLTAFELYTGGCAPTRGIYLLVFALPHSSWASLSAGATSSFDARVVSVTLVDPADVPRPSPGTRQLHVALLNPLHLPSDAANVYLLGFAFADEHCGALVFSSFADPYVLPEALVYSTPLLPRVEENVTLGAKVKFSGTRKMHAEFSLNVWLILFLYCTLSVLVLIGDFVNCNLILFNGENSFS